MSKHLLVVLILATAAFATQLAHRSQPVRRQLECSDFDKKCGDGCIWFAWDCCVDGTYCGPYQVCGLYGGCDLISSPPGASSGLTTASSMPAIPATSILSSKSLAPTTQGSSAAVSDPASSPTYQGSASAPTSVSGVSSGAASSTASDVTSGIASGSASVKPLSPTSAGTALPSSLTQAASSSSASNSQLVSSSTSGTAAAPTSTLVQASGALGAAVSKNAIALGLMMVARHLFL